MRGQGSGDKDRGQPFSRVPMGCPVGPVFYAARVGKHNPRPRVPQAREWISLNLTLRRDW